MLTKKYHVPYFLLLFPLNVFAAQAMKSAVCELIGTVEKIEVRKEYYQDKEWAKSWSLPEYQEYSDISLSIHKSSFLEKGDENNCELKSFPRKFQLRDRKLSLKKGQCIKAKAQFSGDEFIIGHWLYEIKMLKDSSCKRSK